MPWPKGVKGGPRSQAVRDAIRRGVLATVHLRRRQRTKAERRRDAESDPRSLEKQVLTPRTRKPRKTKATPVKEKHPLEQRLGIKMLGTLPPNSVERQLTPGEQWLYRRLA